MEAGISTASFYPMLLEDAIKHLARNHVKNIEVFINTISELEKTYVKELAKQIDANGQKVISVHPFTSGFEPFMLFTNYERRFQDGLEYHRRYFDAMNELGAKIFVFHGNRKQSPMLNRECFERFAKLRVLGKEHGIIVAQENVERCKSGNLDFLVEMISYLDHDVAIVFDNKQALRSGIQDDIFIEAVGPNIVHMHISDRNSTLDCIPLGQGDLNLKSLIRSVGKNGFNGRIMVELYRDKLDSIGDIYKSYNYLLSSI